MKCRTCRKLITENGHIGACQINGTVALTGCRDWEDRRDIPIKKAVFLNSDGVPGMWHFVPLESSRQTEIINLIINEREQQNAKWGFPQQNNFAEWACILSEEFGELSQELNEAHFRTANKEKVITEAIHVAAVAVSIIEHYEVAENTGEIRLRTIGKSEING